MCLVAISYLLPKLSLGLARTSTEPETNRNLYLELNDNDLKSNLSLTAASLRIECFNRSEISSITIALGPFPSSSFPPPTRLARSISFSSIWNPKYSKSSETFSTVFSMLCLSSGMPFRRTNFQRFTFDISFQTLKIWWPYWRSAPSSLKWVLKYWKPALALWDVFSLRSANAWWRDSDRSSFWTFTVFTFEKWLDVVTTMSIT